MKVKVFDKDVITFFFKKKEKKKLFFKKKNGECLWTFSDHKNTVRAVSMDPNETFVISAGKDTNIQAHSLIVSFLLSLF